MLIPYRSAFDSEVQGEGGIDSFGRTLSQIDSISVGSLVCRLLRPEMSERNTHASHY